MYLNSLIENTPLGVVVYDRGGRLQLCNDAFESLFLFHRDELLGKYIDDFIVPPDQASEARDLGEIIASGKRVQVSVQRKRKDGVLIEIELYAVPLILDSEVGGGLAIYTDVTERIQGALRLKDQAEALRRSVTELQARTDQATLLNEMGDFLQSCEASSEAVKVASDYGSRLFRSSNFGAVFILSRLAMLLRLKVGGENRKASIRRSRPIVVGPSAGASRTGVNSLPLTWSALTSREQVPTFTCAFR
jgi:PAS domain S-box-containing protein